MRGLPLRVKLMASMLALLGIGMSFIGVVSVSVLHGYLLDRVDSQLVLLSARMEKKVKSDWKNDRETAERPILIESDAIALVRSRAGPSYRC
ncbi:hypothetical protein ACFQYP_58095 [Nonomuraea antimicrobica]